MLPAVVRAVELELALGGYSQVQRRELMDQHAEAMQAGYAERLDQILQQRGFSSDARIRARMRHSAGAVMDEGYGADDVVHILRQPGGGRNLEAVATHSQTLLSDGYSQSDVVRIAGHIGGGRTLEAVVTHHTALLDAGCSVPDVVSMAGAHSGYKNLEAVMAVQPQLKAGRVPRAQIVAAACASDRTAQLARLVEGIQPAQ